MPITLVYRSEATGPVCKRIAQQDDIFRVVHEDELRGPLHRRVAAPQPPPPDPAVEVWRGVLGEVGAFSQLPFSRVPTTKASLQDLITQLQRLYGALDAPAPQAPPPPPVAEPEVLIRWGSRWVGDADITINTVEATATAKNKALSRQVLRGICPATWQRRGEIQYPCVIRPRRHHAGQRFFVCRTATEAERAISRCGPGWYASELIDKSHEYRVFVLQGRVICVSERFPANPRDVAWNLAAGGRLVNVRRGDWPVDSCRVALKAAKKIGLDWSAVDVMVDQTGRALVAEVNVAPGLRNRYTIEQVAWAFASLVSGDTPAPLDLNSSLAWTDLIHPSLRQAADA